MCRRDESCLRSSVWNSLCRTVSGVLILLELGDESERVLAWLSGEVRDKEESAQWQPEMGNPISTTNSFGKTSRGPNPF